MLTLQLHASTPGICSRGEVRQALSPLSSSPSPGLSSDRADLCICNQLKGTILTGDPCAAVKAGRCREPVTVLAIQERTWAVITPGACKNSEGIMPGVPHDDCLSPCLLSPEQEAEEGVEARGDLVLAGGLGVLQNSSVWKSPVKMGKRVTTGHRYRALGRSRPHAAGPMFIILSH